MFAFLVLIPCSAELGRFITDEMRTSSDLKDD